MLKFIGHTWESFLDCLNDSIIEFFRAPFMQRLGQLSLPPITSLETNFSFIPYDRSKEIVVKEVVCGFLLLKAEASLRRPLNTSTPKVFTGKNSFFDHQPNEEGKFWPVVHCPNLSPYTFFVPLWIDLEIVGFLYTKCAFLLVTPP